MAVPDVFIFFKLGVVYMNFTLHIFFFDLHHSGTQFFLGNVDILFDPKKSLYLTSTKKQSVCGRCFNVHTKSSQCADVKYLTSTSVCPVCDLNLCDLNFESAL